MCSDFLRKLSTIVLILSALPGTLSVFEATFTKCCNIGKQWAMDRDSCSQFPAPVPSVPLEQQSICLSAIEICCLSSIRKTQCENGKRSGMIGTDCVITNVVGGEFHKDCCEACKLGIIAGSMNMYCSSQLFIFGQPWDEVYRECCDAMRPSTKPPSHNASSGQSKNRRNEAAFVPDENENICEMFPGELCAHVCIPTPGSFYCECHKGFELAGDGKSCTLQTNTFDRCKNNPCEHTCTDSGLSVMCSCFPGYRIGSDRKSCFDIDECLLGTDSCNKTFQQCENTIGGYHCTNIDGTATAPAQMPGSNTFIRPEDRRVKGFCPLGYQYNQSFHLCDDIDECSLGMSECQHQSVCENTIGSYICIQAPVNQCPPGYHFSIQENSCLDIDECEEELHNCDKATQTCINNDGGFFCHSDQQSKCPAGYKFNTSINNCQDVNECEENVHSCEESEVCRNMIGGYDCDPKCDSGLQYDWNIKECVDIDECQSDEHVCSPGEKCINQHGGFFCSPACEAGYRVDVQSGECVDIDECIERLDTCHQSKELCINLNGSFTCSKTMECPSGYRKKHDFCEDINECTEEIHVCNIKTESCINEPGGYRCGPRNDVVHTNIETTTKQLFTCPPGLFFHDTYQSCVDTNECDDVDNPPCDSNQECQNTYGSYTCICKTGFHLDPTVKACTDINECQTNSHTCTESQRCDNTIGSYHCIRFTSCGTGYTLNAHTGLCEDDDECALKTDNCHLLGPMWECRNIAGSFRCERKRCAKHQKLLNSGECKNIVCSVGYNISDSGTCTDINECTTQICPRGYNCINTQGSYTCKESYSCQQGFTFNPDRSECTDIDECSLGSHECGPRQTCENNIGGYICVCPTGYRISGIKDCVDINECSRSSGQICSSNSECRNTEGSFECLCKEGFQQDNNRQTCSDIDECKEITGICEQTCTNTWGSYHCSCRNGFIIREDNRTCSDLNECEQYRDRNLCIGICVNEPGSYSCKCPEGYQVGSDGRTCQDIDECQTGQYCLGQNEICVNIRGGYRCATINCPTNYIRDTEHKNRCKRATMVCRQGDTTCLRQPSSYLFNYITFVSNMYIPPSGHLDLFTMRGPTWSTTTTRFSFEVISGYSPHGVAGATKEYFRLRRTGHNQAVIALVKKITGPQEFEVQLSMEIYHNGLFGASAVAKLYIYVSQYEY